MSHWTLRMRENVPGGWVGTIKNITGTIKERIQKVEQDRDNHSPTTVLPWEWKQ